MRYTPLPTTTRALALLTLSMLAALLAWDASDLDMALAHWFGNAQGFPLRDDWFLTDLMHDTGQKLGWLLVLALCLSIWWPLGVMARLPKARRVQFAITTLLAILAVSGLKATSHTSCPWSLSEFGGLGAYFSHWSLLFNSANGRCFPAGHAATGFAFLGGYFAFRSDHPKHARAWLLGAVAVGLGLGWGQQMRGAHFMSHTLWTGLICWCVALALDLGWKAWAQRSPATAPVSAKEI